MKQKSNIRIPRSICFLLAERAAPRNNGHDNRCVIIYCEEPLGLAGTSGPEAPVPPSDCRTYSNIEIHIILSPAAKMNKWINK